MADHDWDAIGNYFITRTPASMFYREFADIVTPTMAETNFTFINYETIKDHGKAGYWVQKRAQHLIQSNPGLYTDAEAVYSILRDALINGKDLPARDLAMLSREMREMAAILRSRDAMLSGSSDDDGRVTRDELLTEVESVVVADKVGVMRLAKDAFQGPRKGVDDNSRAG